MYQFMWGKKDKQVRHYYHRNYTDESLQYDSTSKRLTSISVRLDFQHHLSYTRCVLSRSLFYCISGLFTDMGGIVIS